MSHKKLIAFIILINYFRLKVFAIDLDFNAVPKTYNVSTVLVKSVRAHTNYKLTWVEFTDGRTSAQLVVALPPQLRYRQLKQLPTRIKTEVIDKNASIKMKDPNLIHQGFYSAFKVVNDSLSGLFVEERRDFYIEITDLGKDGDQCSEDADCRSNHCLNSTCVCDKDTPVPLPLEKDVLAPNKDEEDNTITHRPVQIKYRCLTGPPIGSKCLNTSQCQMIGGPDAECSAKHKCRCVNNMFPINIPYHGKYCVQPRTLNDKCMYSEQCQAIGSNRYCDQEMRCQCSPQHTYRPGLGCVHISTSGSSRTTASAHIWSLLAIIIAVHLH